MKKILLCSHDPMLIKGLYGTLRDEGYEVETTDHPAHAVRLIMENRFDAVILDSRAFGLPAEDAVHVIKAVDPEIRIILAGYPHFEADPLSIRAPSDLDVIRRLVHSPGQHNHVSHKKKEEKVWH